MMTNSISVIIPSYRRTTAVLAKAVESVQLQKHPVSEIIVVDDNKNDPALSHSIKKFCKDYQAKYISSGGVGGAGARNRGIDAATGKYIAFLDDDDIWMPEKLSAQMVLFTDPSVGLVFSRGYTVTIKQDGTSSWEYYATDSYYKPQVSYQDLLVKNYIGTTTQLVVRRDILRKLGGFDETLPSRQDYDLCLRVAKEYRCIGSNEYLFIHYLHGGEQITANPHVNLVGYQMLLNKYHNDICHVPGAYCGACYRIARFARLDRSYGVFAKYMLLAILRDPFHIGKTIKKCFGLS